MITRVWLRTHPLPAAERRAAYTFASFADGIEACRPILRARRHARRCCASTTRSRPPAATAATATASVLLVLDEGDPAIVEATMAVVADACADGHAGVGGPRRRLARAPQRHVRPAGADPQGVRRRHDGDRRAVVPARRARSRRSRAALLDGAARAGRARATCRTAIRTAPASTSRSPPRRRRRRSRRRTSALWDAGQRAVLAHGGNLSHHHGVGLNRARFVAEALGPARARARRGQVRPSIRTGILNPGKLGPRLPVRAAAVAMTGGTVSWDWDAIRAGALVALVFAVPFSIAARWAADSRDDSTLAVWLNIGAVRRLRPRRRVRGVGAADRHAAQPRPRDRRRHLPRRPGGVRRDPAGRAASTCTGSP